MSENVYPEAFVKILKDGFIELGSMYGLSLSSSSESTINFEHICFFALISSHFSGFIGLQISRELLLESAPIDLITDEDFANWNKELLNAYSGVLKKEFIKYGIKSSISIPGDISAKQFAGFEKGVGPIEKIYLSTEQGNLLCKLSFSLSRFFKLEKDAAYQESDKPSAGIVF